MDYSPQHQPSSRRRTPAALVAAITTTRENALTLLRDGYRFQPLPEPEGESRFHRCRFAVLRPGDHKAAYAITVYDELLLDRGTGELTTNWWYHCSCPLFAEQSRHQAAYDRVWSYAAEHLGLDGPICKHGEALVIEIVRAHALVAHTLPLPIEKVPFSSIEANVIWDRPADPPTRPAPPEKPGWNPWPTRTPRNDFREANRGGNT